jgi:hypothetical protein
MTKALVAAIPLLLAAASCVSNTDRHVLPESDAADRRVWRKGVAWSLPLNKKWDELTEAQRLTVRRCYEALGDADEPPYPANGMQDLAIGYEQLQKAALASGTLTGAVLVDKHGRAQNVEIFETPDPALNNPVAFIAMKAKYKPAKCSGQPCAMQFPISIAFKLER